jgi:hypothetical protein
MNYNKTNNILGWVCFLIAFVTYILTLEPSASYWDCGEFISAAFKLQIVHQPGAPLFLMIGKVFSLIAGSDLTRVAYWVNISSALASAATILFLFWTITALVKKAVLKPGEELTTAKMISIMGSAVVGALAYTYSDSFWFSAVEAEVYALSSLCTAIVFWAILKWDARADEPDADKWLIFIAYIMGLSIGVHLLNLLAIPAIAFLYYFRKEKNPTTGGSILTFFVGCFILGFIQYGIVQYLIKFAAYSDLLFVNTLGLGFGSGVIFFISLLIISLVAGIIYTFKGVKLHLIIAAASFIALMTVGGGIWGLVTALVLLAVLEFILKIQQHRRLLNLILTCTVFVIFGYGSFAMIVIRAKADPSLNNSDPDNAFALLSYVNREQYGDRPLLYGQYFDSKPVDSREDGPIYRKGEKKYEVAGQRFDYVYDRNTIFPRMYSTDDGHTGFYRDWMKMGESESPTFIQNVGFFFSYQVGFMYARYFLWNFSGRQNDSQGHGNHTDGNWITGIKPIDAMRLGPQDHLPPSIAENNAYNRFFMLPLILGLLGAYWHFKRSQKDAVIVGLLFFFTGIAIVLYLNQAPLQPRERDYAYTGSFYAFAIWIGLGVACISDFLRRKLNPTNAGIIATVAGLLAAPVIMAKEGWNDHDRSTKFTARDLAIDYLESCAPNAILFTYGDNDTYPLWYVQEVENVRPDIRIVNLSLLGTDWYIRQMKEKVNQADPVPITMSNDKFVMGVRDGLPYSDYKIPEHVELKKVFDILMSDNPDDKVTMQDGSKENFLPTKNFKITIDPAVVLATKTVGPEMKDSIASTMEWTYNQNYVRKTELAMLDILAHNNWKRPIYFAITVGSASYIGLDKYLYNEGFASRLLPLKPAAGNPDLINADAMYNNMMNKFKWGNMKNARYLDPESTRMLNIISKNFTDLGDKLYNEGRTEEAKKVVQKFLSVVPERNYYFYLVVLKYYTADLLYKLKEVDEANKLIESTSDYIGAELNYIYSISQNGSNLNTDDVQQGMSVLNEFIKLTEKNGQKKLNAKVQTEFKSLESKFFAR